MEPMCWKNFSLVNISYKLACRSVREKSHFLVIWILFNSHLMIPDTGQSINPRQLITKGVIITFKFPFLFVIKSAAVLWGARISVRVRGVRKKKSFVYTSTVGSVEAVWYEWDFLLWGSRFVTYAFHFDNEKNFFFPHILRQKVDIQNSRTVC